MRKLCDVQCLQMAVESFSMQEHAKVGVAPDDELAGFPSGSLDKARLTDGIAIRYALDPAARHLGDDVPHDAERDGGVVVVRGGAHPAAHTPRSL